MPNYGDYMVTATGGTIARLIRLSTNSPVNHAAVYIGGGFVVEAQPNGARVARVTAYPKAIWSHDNISLHTRLDIRAAAINLIGTPYNFVDIAAQLLVRVFHWQAPKWALERLASPKRLQCAQLVDEAYAMAGVNLFEDGRPFGLVAPSDLYDRIESKNG